MSRVLFLLEFSSWVSFFHTEQVRDRIGVECHDEGPNSVFGQFDEFGDPDMIYSKRDVCSVCTSWKECTASLAVGGAEHDVSRAPMSKDFAPLPTGYRQWTGSRVLGRSLARSPGTSYATHLYAEAALKKGLSTEPPSSMIGWFSCPIFNCYNQREGYPTPSLPF